MRRHRVDTIPWPVLPLYLAAGWACGLLIYFYYLLCRITSRISIEGPGNRDLSQHAIFCMWHESWWSYFVVFLRYPSAHVMIAHPAAYMKPLHTLARLMGSRGVILGSSGEEGKRAVNEAARLVGLGYSTTISPDGPRGPRRALKKGVLHLALQSKVPIVPLTISPSPFIAWPSWDGKRFPLPFGRVKVTVHEALHVDPRNFEEIGRRIVNALAAHDSVSSARAA